MGPSFNTAVSDLLYLKQEKKEQCLVGVKRQARVVFFLARVLNHVAH